MSPDRTHKASGGRPARSRSKAAPAAVVKKTVAKGRSRGKDPASAMVDAEILLINGWEIAIALGYSPGQTPVVMGTGTSADSQRMVWAAHELGIPVVELPAMSPVWLKSIEPGREIPEEFYAPVAQALALIYKSRPAPFQVRYIRLTDGQAPLRKSRARSLQRELAGELAVVPISVEVGGDLWSRRQDLNEAFEALRRRAARELGLLLPAMIIVESAELEPEAYRIRLREVAVAQGEVKAPLEQDEPLWTLVNRMRQVLWARAHQLLCYDDVEALLDQVRKEHPGLYRSLFPSRLTVPTLRLVMKNLLREGLGVKDLTLILETIQEHQEQASDPDQLTEYVRAAMRDQICHRFADGEGVLHAVLLDGNVEAMVAGSLKETASVRWLDLSPDDGLRLLTAVGDAVRPATELDIVPVILCAPTLRRFLRRLTEFTFPNLTVLAYSEITPWVEVKTVGMVVL